MGYYILNSPHGATTNELENQQEPTPEPSAPSESPPVTSSSSIVGIVVLAVTLFSISTVYYFMKRKKL